MQSLVLVFITSPSSVLLLIEIQIKVNSELDDMWQEGACVLSSLGHFWFHGWSVRIEMCLPLVGNLKMHKYQEINSH